MLKFILLIHAYQGEKFLGQKLLWVEVTTPRALGTLIDLLSWGCKAQDFDGTEEYPTSSEGYRVILYALKCAYQNPYRILRLNEEPNWLTADSLRVMQVTPGRPIEEPKFPD